ncbi:hypothetical protein GCM10027193_04610 [Arenimonas aestuarii]
MTPGHDEYRANKDAYQRSIAHRPAWRCDPKLGFPLEELLTMTTLCQVDWVESQAERAIRLGVPAASGPTAEAGPARFAPINPLPTQPGPLPVGCLPQTEEQSP